MPRSLPVELVEAILAELANDEAAKVDLARCCLVSKASLALSRPHLYRTITVEIVYHSPTLEYSIFLRSASLIRTLAASHLAVLPRQIEVEWKVLGVADGRPSRHVLPFLWQRCTNADALGIVSGMEYAVTNALESLQTPPAIARLELHSFEHEAWSTIVALEKTLDELLLAPDEVEVDEEPEEDYAFHLYLSYLHLIYPWKNPAVLLDNVFLSSAMTLTTLELVVTSFSILPEFSAFTQLQNLRRTIPSGSDKAQFLNDLPSVVSPCPILEVLTLRSARPLTASNISTLTSSSPDALPASLPSSLLRLDLFSPLFYPSDLINLLDAAPQAIHLCTIGRQAYELPLGERDRRKKKPRLPTEVDEEELKAVCSRRGVRVFVL